MTGPTDASSAFAIAVNSQLGDKHFRDSIRDMHHQRYPLVKMVEALGLDDDVSPAIREILEQLSPDDVEGIRAATLEMLDRVECTPPNTPH
jgi:DNA-binding GntR family transcriptional regulator